MTDRTDELVAKYPGLLSNVYCGMSMPPGWFDLVDTLCAWIDARDEYRGKVAVAQIKEKFGGLRFYIDTQDLSEPDEIVLYTAVGAAKRLSFRICQKCGAAGSRCKPDAAWLVTLRALCDAVEGKEPTPCP